LVIDQVDISQPPGDVLPRRRLEAGRVGDLEEQEQLGIFRAGNDGFRCAQPILRSRFYVVLTLKAL
jgi:hypothetical protein